MRLIIVAHAALWGAMGTSAFAPDLDWLRAPIVLLFLLWIPGTLILRALGTPLVSRIRAAIYTIALSALCVSVVGLVLNFVWPSQAGPPLRTLPLAVGINVITTSLLTTVILREQGLVTPRAPPLSLRRSDILLGTGLLLIPFAMFLARDAFIRHGTVWPTVCVLAVVAVSPLLTVAYGERARRWHTPLLFALGLTLLLFGILTSYDLSGWDIQEEHASAHAVASSGRWDPKVHSNLNAMLMLVITLPSVAILADIEFVSALKYIFPLVYAVVPVGLYGVFRRAFAPETALLGVFFFISYYQFYHGMPSLPRQAVAEVFLVGILLAATDPENSGSHRNLLITLFAAGLTVSHYGSSYLMIFIIVLGALALAMIGRPSESPIANIRFATLFGTLTVAWYTFVANASALESVSRIANVIGQRFTRDLGRAGASEGLYLVQAQADPDLLHQIQGWMGHLNYVLIVIGLVAGFFLHRKLKIPTQHVALALAAFALVAAGVVIPHFAKAIHMPRLYHIGQLFLSPFLVLAATLVGARIRRPTALYWAHRLIALYLGIYLAYGTGVAYLPVGETNYTLDSSVDYPRYSPAEVAAVSFAASRTVDDVLAADFVRYYLVLRMMHGRSDSFDSSVVGDPHQVIRLEDARFRFDLPEGALLFLGRANNIEEKAVARVSAFDMKLIDMHRSDLPAQIIQYSKLFDSGDGAIYLPSRATR